MFTSGWTDQGSYEELGETCQWRNRHFTEDHPNRLASQHALATAYLANGQVKDAVALLEQIVAIQSKTLAEDHPDQLASQHALGMAYRANGQVKTLSCYSSR